MGATCLPSPAQQQHLIELIRQRETEAALEFAQTQLAEQGEESRECLTEMERTLALLAFDSPEESPFGDLLNMMQRQKVRRAPPAPLGGFRTDSAWRGCCRVTGLAPGHVALRDASTSFSLVCTL